MAGVDQDPRDLEEIAVDAMAQSILAAEDRRAFKALDRVLKEYAIGPRVCVLCGQANCAHLKGGS